MTFCEIFAFYADIWSFWFVNKDWYQVWADTCIALNPLRCMKCQNFGHIKYNCRKNYACSHCGYYDYNEKENVLRCVNCNGKHTELMC